ncbi:MAG: translation initiation factor IF-3 [Candidatus Obscuribacterales bacterium]|nr:translation initiation factor IF-3 [Candidatus Obscuribacterales bacterium]
MSTPDKGDPRRPEARRDLPLLNERIRDREVRLIDEDGAQLGIIPTREALATAKEKGLDLFLVQPDANPPVGRIMDYGRFKFEQEKKNRETKRKHHIVDIKEIKMRYKIEEHDYQVKLKHAIKFLNDGDKIKVLTILRGREMQHKSMAMDLMTKFANELKELGIMDREPKMEGKSVIMILSPLPQRGGKPALPGPETTEPTS